MIEQPPKYNADTKSVSEVLAPESLEGIRKFQEEYPYWSKVKYKKVKGFDSPEAIWNALKQLRLSNQITVNPNYRILWPDYVIISTCNLAALGVVNLSFHTIAVKYT